MKLSDQALGTIMMCLQKAILEESDVTEHLRALDFAASKEERLEVLNPPVFEVTKPTYAVDIGTAGSD